MVTEEVQHKECKSVQEIANAYSCQKVIRHWTEDSQWPSRQMITLLHTTLMGNVPSYSEKGLTPQSPGEYRLTDVHTADHASNFYVGAYDLKTVMDRYGKLLDTMLTQETSMPYDRVEHIVHNATLAYYLFERIHPFLDGNGRIGRMIFKRVTKGNGVKDIIFQHNNGYGKGRNEHLDAMSAVDKSGNLVHLELYFLKQIRRHYQDPSDQALLKEIDEVIAKKMVDVHDQSHRQTLSELWDGFSGIYIDGNTNPDMFTPSQDSGNYSSVNF